MTILDLTIHLIYVFLLICIVGMLGKNKPQVDSPQFNEDYFMSMVDHIRLTKKQCLLKPFYTQNNGYQDLGMEFSKISFLIQTFQSNKSN